MSDTLVELFRANGLLVGFAVVGVVMALSYGVAGRLTGGRLHGSAVAILAGLVVAYLAGVTTGGQRGILDLAVFSGMGIVGGAMLRDFAIISTAYGVRLEVMREAGGRGAASILVGILSSFIAGAAIAFAFGYRDPVALTTIGAGAVTYIVGPVTGTAIGASSDVMALSIGAGLGKAILVMVLTPLVAPRIGLDNPRSAMIFGGIMGTSSGVAAGLAATDPKLVPYGAMTAAFYTAAGCLLGPSVLYFLVRALTG
jgi:malonate transporter MadM subunit